MNEQNLKNHSTFINLLVCIRKDFFFSVCACMCIVLHNLLTYKLFLSLNDILEKTF